MQTSSPRLVFVIRLAFPSLLLGSIFLPDVALAAPIAYDSFEATTTGTGGVYNSTAPTSGALAGQNPTASSTISGFTSAWSNSGGTSDIRVETSGLTHPLLEGVARAGDIYANNNGVIRTITHALSSTVTNAISAQKTGGGEIWFSGLVSSAEAPTTTSPIYFGLAASPGLGLSQTPTTGIMFGIDDGAIRLYVNGVQAGGTGFSITTGVTYLVAAKIDFVGSSSDSVTLEIYSPSAPFGSPTATISATGLNITATVANLGSLTISRTDSSAYSSTANTPRFDEFRLGLTQADVMAIPEPSAIGLWGMAAGALLIFRRRR